ncbi:MAG: S41 family peptidase [Caulobacteraceae bacterium]
MFHTYGLGKLIGTRSWGGVRGIRGNWRLMDGGYITIPEESLYTTGSQWAVENHGVDPDIEVEDQPADLLTGHDAQLETAVAVLMEQIAGKPAGLPAPPPLLPPYPPSGIVPPQP